MYLLSAWHEVMNFGPFETLSGLNHENSTSKEGGRKSELNLYFVYVQEIKRLCRLLGELVVPLQAH